MNKWTYIMFGLLFVLISLAIGIYFHWWMGLVCFVVLCLIFIVVLYLVGKLAYKMVHSHQQEEKDVYKLRAE